MPLPETKVIVEVLKDGRWAQEPWLPQLEVVKGDRVSISISFAHRLEVKGKCRILPDADKNESTDNKGGDNGLPENEEKPPVRVKRKYEKKSSEA